MRGLVLHEEEIDAQIQGPLHTAFRPVLLCKLDMGRFVDVFEMWDETGYMANNNFELWITDRKSAVQGEK